MQFQQPVRQRTIKALGGREFIAMMALLMALQALAIDAMLPGLGQIAADLGVTDPNRRQLVVGVFLLSAGVGSLVPGALADRHGRRPVLLVTIALYVVLALGCALAPDFNTLLVLRALHALASAGVAVLPAAIVRDRFSGDRMARTLSTVSTVFMVVPMLAPSVGQFVLLFAGWRWIFGVLALLAAIMGGWVYWRLPETLDPAHRQFILPMTIARNMAGSAIERSSVGYVLGAALVFGAMLGYVNCSQQLVAEHFGAGRYFPLIFGATALSMSLSNFFNARIVERFGARRVSQTALLACIVLSALQVYSASSPHQTLLHFMPLMAANVCAMGFIGANFSAIALQPFARMAGAASSMQMFTRMLLGSLVGITIGQAYDGTARPLTMSFVACSVVTLGLVLYSEHGRLFRRLIPPGGERVIVDIH
jgi:DHA1 family bicyclomycin/chloramphenicol resistance-like MFS transporter